MLPESAIVEARALNLVFFPGIFSKQKRHFFVLRISDDVLCFY